MAAEERSVTGVALVTGGVRGIGFEVGRPLAQMGMTVILGAPPLPDDGPSGGFFREGEPMPW